MGWEQSNQSLRFDIVKYKKKSEDTKCEGPLQKEIGVLMLCSNQMECENELYDRMYLQSDLILFT